MKTVILSLAVCGLAAAMTVNKAAETFQVPSTTLPPPPSNSTPAPVICEPQTPCAWTTYHPDLKFQRKKQFVIVNAFCKCSDDLTCQIDEENTNSNSYIHHCLTPTEDESRKLRPARYIKHTAF